ncbi:unnamed protein product [Sphagnum jensenii]
MPTRRGNRTTQRQHNSRRMQLKSEVRDAGCLRFADEVFRGLSAMVQTGGCNSARGETQDTEVRERG